MQSPATAEDRTSRRTSLTEGQLLFWFSHQSRAEVQLYFDRVTVVVRIGAAIDAVAFVGAWLDAVALCENLRTRIVVHDGVPSRVVLEEVTVPLEQVDAAGANDPEATLRGRVGDIARLPLADGRPAALLVRTGCDEYAFCLSVHHLLTDAWSTRLVIACLADCYRQRVGRAERPSGPDGFDPFLAHTEGYRGSDAYGHARAYWTAKLAETPQTLTFYSGDTSARRTATFRVSRQLDARQAARVTGGARSLGFFSPAVVFQTALFAYLHRITGASVLRVGCPFANRPPPFATTLGLLMNPCALRVRVDGDTFLSLGRKVQSEYVETARHALFPVRNPSEDRSYEVYFNYQNVAYNEFAGLPMRFELYHSGESNDTLALQVHDFDGDGVFHLDFDFALRAFERAQGEQEVEHFLALLEAMLSDASTPIHQVDILTTAERARIREYNRTARAYGRAAEPMHAMIERQAQATPDARAVIFDSRQLTYSELDAAAARVARHLVERGAGPGRCVAVVMERSIDMVVALLAVLKSGAAYLPIEPTLPGQRVRRILQEATPLAVLCDAAAIGRDAFCGLQPLTLRDLREGSSGNVVRWPDLAATPPAPFAGDPAYIIFTSGSTGTPKGVITSHGAIDNRLLWMQDQYGLTPGDRVLQKTPFGFDVSVWEFFWPLRVGATLVVLPPEKHRDPAFIARAIRELGITVLHFVPSMLRAFLDAADGRLCPSVRRVVCSGEALPADLVGLFHDRFPATSLHNLYGPTEAAVDVSYFDCERGAVYSSVPIGRPIANMRLYVLDGSGHNAPPGITGELVIAGVGLATGYLGQPELTRERFPSVAETLDPSCRVYKTGDLARLLDSGEMEFLGRRDNQVKLRGFRIELGEIEATCRRAPGIRDVVVDVRKAGTADAQLVAYVVSDGRASLEALQERLVEELPEYMVPSLFVPIDAVPLSPNGKLDRKQLAGLAVVTAGSDTPPADVVEETLEALWKTKLGVARVGMTDNFFALGGHSIMAVEILAEVRTRFRCDIPLNMFLKRRANIQTLAQAIRTQCQPRDGTSAQDR